MKRIRNHLPDTIQIKGRTYKLHCFPSTINHSGGLQKVKQVLRQQGYLIRTQYVLAGNLRGKKDFHGKPYQAQPWIFTCKKTEPILHQ